MEEEYGDKPRKTATIKQCAIALARAEEDTICSYSTEDWMARLSERWLTEDGVRKFLDFSNPGRGLHPEISRYRQLYISMTPEQRFEAGGVSPIDFNCWGRSEGRDEISLELWRKHCGEFLCNRCGALYYGECTSSVYRHARKCADFPVVFDTDGKRIDGTELPFSEDDEEGDPVEAAQPEPKRPRLDQEKTILFSVGQLSRTGLPERAARQHIYNPDSNLLQYNEIDDVNELTYERAEGVFAVDETEIVVEEAECSASESESQEEE
eukprot:924380_1